MCGLAVLKTVCLRLDILEEYRLAQDQQRPRFSCGCLPLASPSHCKTAEGLLPVPVALVLLGGAAAGRMRPLWAGARCARQHLSSPGLVHPCLLLTKGAELLRPSVCRPFPQIAPLCAVKLLPFPGLFFWGGNA